MPTLECRTGSESSASSTARFHVFWVPSALDTRTSGITTETFISAATRKTIAVRNIRHVVDNAYPGKSGELGKWATSSFDIVEGTVLKLFGTNKAGWNRLPNTASLYIQMRADAAYREVRMPLTGSVGARYTYAYAKGRFDILSLEEASAHGISPMPHFVHLFSADAILRTFTTEVKDAEVSAKVVIATKSVMGDAGERVTIRTKRRVRHFDFGPK